MDFHATKQRVLNRGVPPDSFLDELVAWGRSAPDEIFAPNANTDVYSNVVAVLGPWQDLRHRRAVMLEVMRVLAGFESSWNWNAGVGPHCRAGREILEPMAAQGEPRGDDHRDIARHVLSNQAAASIASRRSRARS